MKATIGAVVIATVAVIHPAVTWTLVAGMGGLLYYYWKLRMDYKALQDSDPVKMNARLLAENGDLMKKLNNAVSRMDRMEAEYREMVDYRGRYTELQKSNNNLQEMFADVNKRFDKMQGELDHYKALFIQQRNLNEDAKHGDL